MRKFLIPLLMASAVLPAAAYAEPGDRGVRNHGERSESNDNSSQSRPQRVHIERSNSDGPRVHVDRSMQVDRHVDVQTSEPTRVRRFERHGDGRPVEQVTQPVQDVRRVDRHDDRNRDRNGGFVDAIRQVGEDGAQGRRDGVVVHRGDRDHDGDHRWGDGDRDGRHRWDRDWRRDARYNWHSYRNRYGSLFRLGRYYDPYGWNYSRFSIGYNLWPSYYGSNYWLNDPLQYRLPPAYGPYRWVRYYDDALLVNIYTGQVVDVIYNVFW